MDWTAVRQAAMEAFPEGSMPPEVKVPVFPTVVTRFSERANDPKVETQELGSIIDSDSGLAVELLRYVNSSTFGMRHKVSTGVQAITTLGIKKVQLFLLQAAVKRAMRVTESKLIHIPNFWGRNLERALLARHVARLIDVDSDVAFAASMLQDFMLPFLSNELYPVYREFVKRSRDQDIRLPDFEQKQFGWDHSQMECQLMMQWGFPDELICCVLMHHLGLEVCDDPQFGKTTITPVVVSALIPGQIRQTPDGMDELFRAETVIPGFNLLEMAKTVNDEFEEMSSGLQEAQSFLRMCQQAAIRRSQS